MGYTVAMTIEQTTEIPVSRRLVFDLPLELPIGRAKIELTITPEKRAFNPSESGGNGKSAFGCLHRFANPAAIAGEKGAWARAVVERYEKD